MSVANARALLTTLLVIVIYAAGRRIHVTHSPVTDVLSLGLGPAISTFFLVEFLSFFVPPLTRFRCQGVAGRRKLNRVAWIAMVVVALAQAFFYARYLLYARFATLNLPLGDQPYSYHSEATFLIVVTLSLSCGSLVTCLLALLLSHSGVANGFCLMGAGYVLLGQVSVYMGWTASPDGSFGKPDLGPLILLTGGIAAAWWFVKRVRGTVQATTPDGQRIEFELPALPQGLPEVDPKRWTVFGSI